MHIATTPPQGLVVAGTHSGVGKTTLTLGLIHAFRRRGLTVQPFKVGPDFIDPGHHTRVAGRSSRNLDGWMLSREANLAIFGRRGRGADLLVVEGVMGLFDGFAGDTEDGSTAQMAKWVGLPVLLVVDARSMARSVAALVQGFTGFDPDLAFLGLILNRVGGPRHRQYLEAALGQAPGVRSFGALPREADLAIPERHLGLATTEDHPLTDAYLDRLADLLEAHLDLDGLLAAAPAVRLPAVEPLSPASPAVRLGVARDRAFCFYYWENLEYLAYYGAELVFFSPLQDRELPADLHGLYLGGGYPELSAPALADNDSLRRAIREAAAAGLPIYAECGGLMYLSDEIRTTEGRAFPMTGVLPLQVRMLPRLQALGYREVTLAASCLLGPAGARGRGHEFHYSEIVSGADGLARLYRLTPRTGKEETREGFAVHNVLASYVHLHFAGNPDLARHLVAACREYKRKATGTF
ncbi:MAG: cobyrinate a,c-diamide synthase [Deltaproteobacteria bacterium]|nr:cobyrinate a,c-diamide synthase [Deltaproteobacteria bacterium]